jgi:hypothetical protein
MKIWGFALEDEHRSSMGGVITSYMTNAM